MDTLARHLFDFEAEETKGEKIHFRLLELVVIGFTLRFCWDWGFYIGRNIETVLLPLGVANHIDISFMFSYGVALVNAGLVSLLCLIGFARLWRPAYALALLLFHLQYAARYCLGEISHGSNLIGMSLLALGLAMLFFHDPTQRRRFTKGFLYFFVGIGYTSAGFCKLIGTGLSWPDGHHLWMWIAERQVDVTSKFGAFDPNGLQDLILSDYRVGTLILAFGLMMELTGVLMWWRPTRYVVATALVGMHIGVVLTMNIFFTATTVLMVLLALPWPAIIDRVLSGLKSLISSSSLSTALDSQSSKRSPQPGVRAVRGVR